jgi:hypothetical protein
VTSVSNLMKSTCECLRISTRNESNGGCVKRELFVSTYDVTHCIQRNSSSEAHSYSTSQYTAPPPHFIIPHILSHMNLVHTHLSYFS